MRFTLNFKKIFKSKNILFIHQLKQEIPARVSCALVYLKEDLELEFNKFPDRKQKTIFCLKLIGAFSTGVLGPVFVLQSSRRAIPLTGLNTMTIFHRIFVRPIFFKLTRKTLISFLNHLESSSSAPKNVQHVIYFRCLLQESSNHDLDHGKNADPAIDIVQNFKKYIMTGKRRIG